ncbi:DUF1289 domain-containing protein [Thiopseudomonas acetoxidans]|uniref:DUF1289 domain-containing protein n=1 Tax=Thiopseudomonas acetoxidans TaxID=3041622 RepID=A0ABT7SQV0_9GAMM|nr:DUF1289 domain-containing protein [Thiopseudomonas sp. CY1220]MDM7857927.1 DUF1289 domain-containing protein [Thiopseudomonas sp. CY1220]NLC09035.1 DUF1289 domain-containing protein [Gammaproteobacteria bacterium]
MTHKPYEKPVPSPCVSICALDDNEVCIGCQRTGDEIIRWGKMDNNERRAVLARLTQRAQAQGLITEE